MTGRATLLLGGDIDSPARQRRVTHVDARTGDAVAIGTFFCGLAFLNLALGIPGRRRLIVFWIGACLFLAALGYGAWKAVAAVITLFG